MQVEALRLHAVRALSMLCFRQVAAALGDNDLVRTLAREELGEGPAWGRSRAASCGAAGPRAPALLQLPLRLPPCSHSTELITSLMVHAHSPQSLQVLSKLNHNGTPKLCPFPTGIDVDDLANPLQACVVSALSFSLGAAMPILAAAFIADWRLRMAAVLAAVSVGLVRGPGVAGVAAGRARQTVLFYGCGLLRQTSSARSASPGWGGIAGLHVSRVQRLS